MSRSLDEFFAEIEEEFSVDTHNQRDMFDSPGDVIDYVAAETIPADGMDEEEHRDHVASVIGEIMARTLGVTRYRENSRFQDLKIR